MVCRSACVSPAFFLLAAQRKTAGETPAPQKPAFLLCAIFQDFQKRPVMQLFNCNSGQAFRLRFADRSAIDRAQEEIQQALAGGGVVEHVADERGLRRFLDKILEARGGRIESFKKKRKYCRVARGQLRRMQVPSLIVRGNERVLDM